MPKTSADHQWVMSAVDRFEGPLVLYASRLLGDPERARDVVQDAFLKLCSQDARELDGRLAEWLYTVCRNQALDVMRKERRMSLIGEGLADELAGPDAPCGEALERREDAARALEFLEGLPANQREVIRLKFQHEFSYKEISGITGLSVSHVGVLIHHGIKALRAKLVGGEPAPAVA